MKIITQWNALATANKSTGASDIGLAEHLTTTGQMSLPQADILLGCMEALRKKDLIEAAYLRGSLARGHGDLHSDIDLFTVVEPAKLPGLYQGISDYIEERGGVVTACHDRLVEDFGGMGFMFIARNGKQGSLYQFDLYMAMKGVAPAKPVSIKPRIFARDPSYIWMNEFGTPRDINALPQATRDFMQAHTSGNSVADRVELLAQETLLTLYVTSKHMKRGQTSRLIVDNKFLISSCVEMLQAISGYTAPGYTPDYLGNEVAGYCRKNGDPELAKAATRLEKLFIQPMSARKLVKIMDFCETVLAQGFPDRHARQKHAFNTFRTDVFPALTAASRSSKPLVPA